MSHSPDRGTPQPSSGGRGSPVRDVLPFAGLLALVIGAFLVTTFLYVRLSDGLRGYINGESLWTKAQKEAVFELDEYAATGDSADLAAYREALEVPLAYRRARELLVAPELDRRAAREAIVRGGTDPDDVAEMIQVMRWFRGLPAVQEALDTWARGDSAIVELRAMGRRVQATVDSVGPDTQASVAVSDSLRILDERLTELERSFSVAMGELDQRLSRTFLAVLVVLGALLLALGTGVTWTLLGRIRSSEAAVRDREERLRLVTRATNDVIWDFDPRTGETVWSDAVETTFGYGDREATRDFEWWKERVHPGDRERVVGELEEVLYSDGELFTAEYRFRRADGRYAIVYDRGFVVRDEAGEPVRMIGSILDLTENRQIERALERSEARYQELLEQASDAILILTPDLRIEMVNGEACEILGYDREELLGMNVRELVAPESLEEEPLRVDQVRRGETLLVEREVLRKDGTVVPMEFSTRQLEDGRIQTIGRDIRQRRELEARLRQSQKMEAVGRLAGGIAHDFNNLLTAVRGHVQLLLAELDPDDPRRDDARAADRAAERAATLVARLLTFSRKRPAQPRVVELNQQLEEMAEMLDRLSGERVEIVLELGPQAGRIRIDPVEIEQVVLNLVLNARDAMPGGGTVRVRTAGLSVTENGAESSNPGLPPGRYARIRVEDDGVGMTAETRERIFEPFYTEKESGEGTGLGLATVYGIVDQVGGEIRVESEVGEGSTFELYLPTVAEGDGGD